MDQTLTKDWYERFRFLHQTEAYLMVSWCPVPATDWLQQGAAEGQGLMLSNLGVGSGTDVPATKNE